jgi:hypothetical protein
MAPALLLGDHISGQGAAHSHSLNQPRVDVKKEMQVTTSIQHMEGIPTCDLSCFGEIYKFAH